MDLFGQLNRDDGITIILVTHDAGIARHSHRTIALRDGKIIADSTDSLPATASLHSHLDALRRREDVLYSQEGSEL
jgi:ABC-type lipoprotein export system ATPase subunit